MGKKPRFIIEVVEGKITKTLEFCGLTYVEEWITKDRGWWVCENPIETQIQNDLNGQGEDYAIGDTDAYYLIEKLEEGDEQDIAEQLSLLSNEYDQPVDEPEFDAVKERDKLRHRGYLTTMSTVTSNGENIIALSALYPNDKGDLPQPIIVFASTEDLATKKLLFALGAIMVLPEDAVKDVIKELEYGNGR